MRETNRGDVGRREEAERVDVSNGKEDRGRETPVVER